jgi:hypothetical protein
LKNLPTVVASPARDLGIELTSFDGSHPIENRDAIGFYYNVRLQPSGEASRVAVLFSGTVLAVRPDAFGLPSFGDRETALRTFAESAIGDFLEDNGLPEFTPSGVAAAKIESFTPRFQDWSDRRPASDDLIEQYLFAHARWSWKFAHSTWTVGPSDLVRLRQSFANVLRIVRLYEKDAWTLSGESDGQISLTPTSAFLRQSVGKRVATPSIEPEPNAVTPDLSPAAFVYVDEARIADLRRLESEAFDLRKLIAYCEELNQCYRAQCYHAVAALTRGVIDHVPPVFACRTFAEVANNYAGTRSFKDAMRRLEEAARKIADSHLHTPIRKSEVLPTRVQVNFSNEVDVLLSEVIRVLQPTTKPK